MTATVHHLRPVPVGKQPDLLMCAWNLFQAELESGLFSAVECRTRFSQHVLCIEEMEKRNA